MKDGLLDVKNSFLDTKNDLADVGNESSDVKNRSFDDSYCWVDEPDCLVYVSKVLQNMTKFLIVVVGPTAVGKTELSIQLAKHFGTVILSADSRQLFRELNVGTAKPTLDEQQHVPHYFVDSHSIMEDYNAGMFERDALALLAQVFEEKDVVVVTGGSGLYVQALLTGMDKMPEVDSTVRQQLMEEYEQAGLETLLTELNQTDPAYARQVDRANPQRVIRALEVVRSTGKPYSAFRTRQPIERPFRAIKLGLNRERTDLYARIDARMDAMLLNGLVEEARKLLPYQAANALQTVGYSEVFGYLADQYDYAEMVRLLKRNSRRYAKRQLTWFTKDAEIRWFHPDDYAQMVAYAGQQLRQ